MNKQVANFIAKAVLTAAEQYEKRTGKTALKFLIELPATPPDAEPLATDNEISIHLSSYTVDVEVLDTPTEPTYEGN